MIVNAFVDGVIGAASASIIGGVIIAIKTLLTMQHSVRHLVKMGDFRAADLEAIAKIQRPILVGVKASLEAARDGECNGNVTEAHGQISIAIRDYDDYLSTLIRRGK